MTINIVVNISLSKLRDPILLVFKIVFSILALWHCILISLNHINNSCEALSLGSAGNRLGGDRRLQFQLNGWKKVTYQNIVNKFRNIVVMGLVSVHRCQEFDFCTEYLECLLFDK